MKIEHLALYVKDLEQTKQFFETYFNAKAGEKYHNPKTSFLSYFLSFESGARLEIMTRSNLDEQEKLPFRTGYHHLAFSVGSQEKVNGLTERFRQDGFTIVSNPRTTGDGYYESVMVDLEGNLIEITV